MKKEWKVPDVCEGQSIRHFLKKRGEFSRQLLKRVKTEGRAMVNGEETELWRSLETNDRLEVAFPEESRGASMRLEDGPLSIVYEDEDIIVLNKPSGISVIPSIDKGEPSIANRLLHYYEKKGIPVTVHIVTRLDKYTSGLMVVAKHAYSHMLLTKKQKLIKRYYQALVQGHLKERIGEIDRPIGRLEGSIIKRTVTEEGKPSVTRYKVLKEGSRDSLVQFELLTGRTHQIRVHMASIGHPLVGDTLYEAKEADAKEGQALHCHLIQFLHPWTKEDMVFEASPPDEWEAYLI
ncbi:RluA family pseudouridine synthase [Halobacillus salinus]|uniref:RluA family pseudouridine synthase n=1 Tax=Halobacillus salinus TaxID=192814 RepID=UPI0026DB5057|nr:RluA family pseudouridine synthase [Halobacillus salinus]